RGEGGGQDVRRPVRRRPRGCRQGRLGPSQRAEGAGLRRPPRPGGLPEAAGGGGGQVRAERQAKRLIAPSGDSKPTTKGAQLGQAELCTNKKLYRASAGLCADGFGVDPKPAHDLKAGHRSNTACLASLV